jgi:hypothetical protein
MSRLVAVALVACVLEACAEPEEPLAGASAAVFDGTEANGDPAVVALVDEDRHLMCSGVLISSKVILTAGHCAAGRRPTYAFFGRATPSWPAELVRVRDAIAHPEYSFDDFRLADLGVVILRERSPVPPLPWNRAPLPADFAGSGLRVVGFGLQTPAGPLGIKMQTEVIVETLLGGREYEYAQGTCAGDSGGPHLRRGEGGEERVVGVTSYGRGECGGVGGGHRVDPYAAWLDGMIATHDPPSCAFDHRCVAGCPGADPDCPCAADGHCSALCADPGSDVDCPRDCVAGNTCLTTCPLPDPDCGDPCGEEGHCLQSCTVRDPDCAPEVGEGAPCLSGFDCGSGTMCLTQAPGDEALCTRTCELGGCGAGFECLAIRPGVSACLLPRRTVLTLRSPAACAAAPGAAGRDVRWILLLAGLAWILRGRSRRLG